MKPDCEHEGGTHCVHSSERRSFRGCRRRWDWAFRHHYVPETSPKPLELGIAFHTGMEQVYEPTRWYETTPQEKLKLAIDAFTAVCEQQRERFLNVTHQRDLVGAHGDDYAERIELGKGMLTHYVLNVHPIADHWFKPVMVEVPFSVPLTYPKGIKLPEGNIPGDYLQCSNSPMCGQTHPNPGPVTLNGRVDCLVEDLINGGYYVVDWKSAAQLIGNGEFLQLDDQITSYCAALQLILNIDIRGFLYAEIKKAYPQPPKKLSRLREGKWFSTNKQQDTSLDLVLETIQEYDESAYMSGFYDDYLQYLRDNPPTYHQRFPLIQSDAKLYNVLDNVAMESMDMTDPDLRLYPSPSKMNCGGCLFKAPCLGKMNNDDYIHTLETLYGRRGE